MNNSWIAPFVLFLPIIAFVNWLAIYGTMSEEDVSTYLSVVQMVKGSDDNAIVKIANFNPTHPSPSRLWIACSVHGVEVVMASTGIIDQNGTYHGENVPAMTTKDIDFNTPPNFDLKSGEIVKDCVVAASRKQAVNIFEFNKT